MKLRYQLLLIVTIFVSIFEARADIVDPDGILRNDDGSIFYTTHRWAEKACPTGTHLPSIRELAELSQKSGSKGILERNQVDPIRVPAGYHKISAINSDGKWDEFYFSNDGYEPPAGDLGSNWFWSSSSSFYGAAYCYALRDTGEPYWVRHESRNAVRCIANQ